MRIVEIVPQLSSGGCERFVVDLSNELAEMGNEVLLLVHHPLDNPLLSFYLPEVSDKVMVKSLNKKMGADWSLSLRIRKEIRKFRPDIVHTHLNGIFYTAFSSLTFKKPLYFHTVHSAAKEEAGPKVNAMVRKLMFKSGRFLPVTISDESLRSFEDYYHRSAAMIFNGRRINFELIKKPQEELSEGRIIVNLARIMTVKRQDLIARICKRLEDEEYKFTMLSVGRNGDQSIIDSINATNCRSFKMLGEKNNPLDYLSAADGYCLMSSYEGMPISLLEAMACECVPVCTPVGGIVNVVKDGVNGILAEDISEEACYNALKRFLELPEEQLIKMKIESRKSFEPFSMKDCATKYVELFEKSLRER